MMPRISTQLAMVIAIVVLGAIIIFAGPAACQKIRSMKAQSRMEHSQAEAASNSASDAIGTVTGVGGNTAASEDLGRTNERDIRAAPGANDKVNPAATAAGRLALCKRAAYRDDPKCKGANR